ncbi:hypothetical protein HDU79_009213 [Rhizoclosmatium sp. JEL0117]|nr:hypothetical protein HDU79_009213 [Rhizoclosmatium sp. JEL0117]
MLYFTTTDVDNLRQYSYKSIDKSFIATKILNPYWWSLIIEYVPRWVAPNLITLTGFLCIIINLILLLLHSPSLTEPIPSYLYVSFALGLFAYQSLDAIDGKQARRTGTSSPLGELFDHGCDALNTGFATFFGVTALGLGQTWWQLFTVYSCIGNFYLSTWEEYYTSTLYLSECSGPIEGVFTIIAILLTTSVTGPEIWSEPLPIIHLPVNILFVAFGCIVIVWNVYTSYSNVLQAVATNPGAAERFKKYPPLLTLSPYLFLVVITSILPLSSATLVESASIVPFVIFITFLFAQQIGSIIVAHVSKRGFPVSEMIAPGIYLSLLAGSLQIAFGNGLTLWWGLAVSAGSWYALWAARIILDMCEIFDINCLSIKKRSDDSKLLG